MAEKRNRNEYHKQWLQKFKAEHGISYATYRKRLQIAELIADYETAGNPGSAEKSKKGNN